MIHLLALAAAVIAAPPPATDCANAAAALTIAAPGSTVTLTGACTTTISVVGRAWSPPVTVDGTAATLAGVALNKVSGLTWRGGSFDGGGTAAGGFVVWNSDHVTLSGATFTNFRRAAVGLGPEANDVHVSGVVITRSGADGVDIGLSHRVQVDHVICMDFTPTPGAHPDCIQAWSRPTNAPVADLTITDNVAVGQMQGFSLFNHVRGTVDDGGFDRVTIARNLVIGSEPDGISVYTCRGCTVTGNDVRTMPGAAHVAHLYVAPDSVGAVVTGNVQGVRP